MRKIVVATDILFMDEIPEYTPYRGGRPKFIYIDEYPELMEPKTSERDDKPKKRKDFWNELPKPKRKHK